MESPRLNDNRRFTTMLRVLVPISDFGSRGKGRKQLANVAVSCWVS
jgi:hypothetical protein